MTMIRHIVLLKFKQGISATEIQSVFDALHDLRLTIPQILHFNWGPYKSNEGLNKGYTHGFVMEFENETARDIYLVHPDHVRVANEIVLPALENGKESVIAFDYPKYRTTDEASIKSLIAAKNTASQPDKNVPQPHVTTLKLPPVLSKL